MAVTNPQQAWARCETCAELHIVVRLAQEMTRRLGSETHGQLFNEVSELAELLQQVRTKVEHIRSEAEKP